MLTDRDLEDLREARMLLEHPGLAVRIATQLGRPIEAGLERLPAPAARVVDVATRRSLQAALSFAVATMDDRPQQPSNWSHKVSVAATGAVGGAFGLAALAVELPVSTTLMLRSIADVARSQGENLRAPDARLACLQVFAFGGRSRADDAAESAYFAVRLALARAMAEAAEYIAARGAATSAPALVRFVGQVAARFSIPVTQKTIAQALPLVGAAGGAMLNTLFIDHFQGMARGHFVVRRLERVHGPEEVQRLYMELDDD